MDHKPLVTYAGDVNVFQSAVPSLQKGMGAEAVEWKRAYGRTTKHVHLHPRFIPFEPDLLSANNASQTIAEDAASGISKDPPVLTTLLDQPMLHTYWTECADVEVYRSTTKDSIQTWLNYVKGCNVRDWLIILVEIPDNKKTKQLLPRSSVLDRIKNDFAQKQLERCICLSDPTKLDSKSAESLHTMLHRLRQLLLASYSKTLTKFEENMRAQREKRTEAGWNFCHYFLLQEELAFVLEMLEVYDEALVQYDELDALFTQFVLNSHLTDTPQWLLSFQRSGDTWPALSLTSSNGISLKTREDIRTSAVSLLSFRNYLFARQASLLVKQRRVNELAQRSLGFLHNCINELSILDVTFTEEGSTSCWVFASCLEILRTICGHGVGTPLNSGGSATNGNLPNKTDKTKTGKERSNTSDNNAMSASDFSVHTASLWDYAREKLYDLGKLGGLLPKSQTKSDYLHKVISLAAGLSSFQETSETSNNNSNGGPQTRPDDPATSLPAEEEPHTITPIEKLKNALSSKEQFETHYLELCELAMGTYKHIGRIRSARKVGLDLADYYMDANEFHKAIVFLTDALKTFRDDKWNLLVVEALLKLARCYQAINEMDRYIRTCSQLACCEGMSAEKREEYFDEMMKCLENTENREHVVLSSTEDTFDISSLKVDTVGKINLDSCDVNVTFVLNSKLPKAIHTSKIQVAILHCDPSHDHHSVQNKAQSQEHQNLYQNLSSASFSSTVFGSNTQNSSSAKGGGSRRSSKELSRGLKADAGTERHKLERKESVNPSTCEDEDVCLSLNSEINLSNIRLELGQSFDTKQDRTIQAGKLLCHNPHHALRRKDSQAKGETLVLKTDFSVAAKATDIIINPGPNTITLHAKVLSPGSFRLGQVSISLKQFELVSPRMGCRYKFNIEKVPGTIQLATGDENLSLIAGIEQIITLSVFTGSNQIDYGMFLNVRASLGLQVRLHENSPLCSEVAIELPTTKSFCSTQIQLRVKAELGPQKDNSVIEHKLMAKNPWTSEETKLPIVFIPPFMSSYKLHTTLGCRKFVQVNLHGLSDSSFHLSSHQLLIQGNMSQNIPLVALNPRSQELTLTTGQVASYMWEVGVKDYQDDNSIRFEFSIAFSPSPTHPPELYKYYFCLQRFKTNYEIKSRIEPHKNSEFCRVGNMCSMLIEIMKMDMSLTDAENSLMYEVRADQHMWAICGRTSGVVSMEGCELQQVSLDVMPMSPGFLPLPTVYLSKYIPADQKASNSSVPKLDPFHSGQVFNLCKGAQMHVLPPPQTASSTLGSTGGSGPHIGVVSDTHF